MSMTTVYDKYLEQAPSYSELKTWLYMMNRAERELAEQGEPTRIEVSQISYTLCISMNTFDATMLQVDPNNMNLPEGYEPAPVASMNGPMDDNRRSIETVESYLAQHGTTRFSISQVPPSAENMELIAKELPGADLTGVKICEDPMMSLDKGLVPDLNYDAFPRGYASLGRHLLKSHIGYMVPASRVPLYTLRELRRLAECEYTELPEDVRESIPPEIYAAEVPHLAVKGTNAGKIAYTENATKGDNDVQSVMKPGKYIRRVMKESNVSDQELKDMVAEMQSASRVDIMTTRDPEEAKWVYMNGPDSCMTHGEDRFNETFDEDDVWRHPMEALFFEDGSGEVELVYAMANNGRPAARVLTNAEINTYPIVYGADWMPAAKAILEEWLNNEGYKQTPDALQGLKIPMIELNTSGKVLCPYIDSNNLGVDPGISAGTMTIGGEYEADYDDGFIDLHSNRLACHECGDRYDDDDMVFVESVDEHVCDTCLEDNFVEALDEDGSVDLHRDIDCEHLDHPVTADSGCGRVQINHITERVTDGELEDYGLCRSHRGIVEEQDDCMMADDIEEWVLIDEIETDTSNEPESVSPAAEFVVLHNDEVACIRDAIYAEELEGWVHEDEIDNATERPYTILRHPDKLRTAELDEEDDDDAA